MLALRAFKNGLVADAAFYFFGGGYDIFGQYFFKHLFGSIGDGEKNGFKLMFFLIHFGLKFQQCAAPKRAADIGDDFGFRHAFHLAEFYFIANICKQPGGMFKHQLTGNVFKNHYQGGVPVL